MDMHAELIKIKNIYNQFSNSNEENIKIHVVSRILEILGYDKLTFNYEHPMLHRKGRADIAIKITDEEYLFVETKKPNHPLNEDEIEQLSSYLFNRSLEWGILTNGKQYILLNNLIKTLPNSVNSILNRVIFKIDIFNPNDNQVFEYFSKKNLFKTKTTHFFRDIAQFKALRYPASHKSWAPYKSTLIGFFTYYAQQEKRYRNLQEIRIDDFEEYLIYDKDQKKHQKKNMKSKETIKNKYSHIRSFFFHLKKNNIIPSHHFVEGKKKLMESLKFDNEIKNDDVLQEKNIEIILNFYRSSSENSLRNEVLFLLCLYLGLDRSSIEIINKDMFSIDMGIINIKGRKIPLPTKLHEKIDLLFKENKKKKIKGNHLLYTHHKKVYYPTTGGAINSVFESLVAIDRKDKKWSNLSPSFIRINLIKKLFLANYSIEEIAYLTGSDLPGISKIITYEDILNKVDLIKGKRDKKEHPFSKFL
jgi:site-specific recombinase XerD